MKKFMSSLTVPSLAPVLKVQLEQLQMQLALAFLVRLVVQCQIHLLRELERVEYLPPLK